MTATPTFTDVAGRRVTARIISDGGVTQLILIAADTGEEILRLNSFDAALLAETCDLYLNRTYAVGYQDVTLSLTPQKIKDITAGA